MAALLPDAGRAVEGGTLTPAANTRRVKVMLQSTEPAVTFTDSPAQPQHRPQTKVRNNSKRYENNQ